MADPELSTSFQLPPKKKPNILITAFILIMAVNVILAVWYFLIPETSKTIGNSNVSREAYNTAVPKYRQFFKYANNAEALSVVESVTLNRLFEDDIVSSTAKKLGIVANEDQIEKEYQLLVSSYKNEQEYLAVIQNAYGWTKEDVLERTRILVLQRQLEPYVLDVRWGAFISVQYQPAGSYIDPVEFNRNARTIITQIYQAIQKEGFDAVYARIKKRKDSWRGYGNNIVADTFMWSRQEEEVPKNDLAILFATKEGEVTKIIPSTGGYHAIYRIDTVGKGSYATWQSFIEAMKKKQASLLPSFHFPALSFSLDNLQIVKKVQAQEDDDWWFYIPPDPTPQPTPASSCSICSTCQGSTVKGRIYDKSTQQGFAGVSVTAKTTAQCLKDNTCKQCQSLEDEGWCGPSQASATTDSQGYYQFPRVDGGLGCSINCQWGTRDNTPGQNPPPWEISIQLPKNYTGTASHDILPANGLSYTQDFPLDLIPPSNTCTQTTGQSCMTGSTCPVNYTSGSGTCNTGQVCCTEDPQLKICDQPCSSNSECQTNYCYPATGTCRNSQNPSSDTCSSTTPTCSISGLSPLQVGLSTTLTAETNISNPNYYLWTTSPPGSLSSNQSVSPSFSCQSAGTASVSLTIKNTATNQSADCGKSITCTAPPAYYCENNACKSSSSCPAGQTCYTSSSCDNKCAPPKIYQCNNQSCSTTSFTDTAACTGKTCYAEDATCGGRTCKEVFYACSGSSCAAQGSPGDYATAQECKNVTGKTCYLSSTCDNSCALKSCNQTCTGNTECQTGYCVNNRCRNPANPSSPTCSSPPPPSCSSSQCQYLDPATNTCKSSCSAGQTCVSGICKSPSACNGACTFDSDCLSGYTCVATGGTPPKVCRKSSCTSDASCTCGAQCSPSSPCPNLNQNGQTISQYCSSGTCTIIYPPSESCTAGFYKDGVLCRQQKVCNDFCLSSSQCQSGFCDSGASNSCRNASCSSQANCICPAPVLPTPTPTPLPGIAAFSATCGAFNVQTDPAHIPLTVSWNSVSPRWLQIMEVKNTLPPNGTWLLNEWVLGPSKTITVSAGNTYYVREGNLGTWKNLGSCRVFHGYVVVDRLNAQGQPINPGKKDPDESCYAGNAQIILDNTYSFVHSSTASCNLYSYVLYDQVPKSHTIQIALPAGYQLTGVSGNDGGTPIAKKTQPVTIVDAEVNFGVGANIPTPIPTLTPTPTITPTPIPQKPWIKVKGASFQRMRKAYGKTIVNTIPSLPSPFDGDDTGEAYFLIGEAIGDKMGGVATSFTSLGMREETISSSGFYDISTYPSHGTPFDRDLFVQYILSKKHYTVLQTVPQGISQEGIYWYRDTDGFFLPNLTLSSSSVFPPVPVVLISDEKIYITDNLTPPSSLAILAKSIVISPSVSSIKALLIADTIETGVNDTLGLKITGNMATGDLQQGRSQGALNNKPALFIVHDIKQYMDLLPYLSVVQGEKWERN